MKKQTKKPKVKNPDFLKAVGQSSILRIDWKSWDTYPRSGEDIWVIVRLDKEVIPVTATYFDEIISTSEDGHSPKTRWRSVKFTDYGFPDTFVGPNHKDKNFKRLIAWGTHRGIIRLAKLPKKWPA